MRTIAGDKDDDNRRRWGLSKTNSGNPDIWRWNKQFLNWWGRLRTRKVVIRRLKPCWLRKAVKHRLKTKRLGTLLMFRTIDITFSLIRLLKLKWKHMWIIMCDKYKPTYISNNLYIIIIISFMWLYIIIGYIRLIIITIFFSQHIQSVFHFLIPCISTKFGHCNMSTVSHFLFYFKH